MRVAFIGVSHWHIPLYLDPVLALPDAEVVGVSDPSLAAAERVAARLGLPVLEWGVAPEVAGALNAELGTAFAGIAGDDLTVDRAAQRRAIECHASQAHHNPVLERRLALQGDIDRVRLRRP